MLRALPHAAAALTRASSLQHAAAAAAATTAALVGLPHGTVQEHCQLHAPLASPRPLGGWAAFAPSRAASSSSAPDGGDAGAIREIGSVSEYDAVMRQLADAGSVGIIDFTAKWCGPCKAIAPIYEQLAKQYAGVAFLKIDIDNEAMAPVVTEHGITGVPTFSVFKGARKVEHFTGARVDLLRSVLQKHSG